MTSVRVNMRFPKELWDAVGRVAGERGRTTFVLEALEAALGNRGGPSAGNGDEGVPSTGRAPASPRAPEPDPVQAVKQADEAFRVSTTLRTTYELEAGSFTCPIPDCGYSPPSGSAQCPVHGRRVVPA